MRYNIKTLLAVGMAAAVLTARSGGGTETKDSGQTVSETDGGGGAAVQGGGQHNRLQRQRDRGYGTHLGTGSRFRSGSTDGGPGETFTSR